MANEAGRGDLERLDWGLLAGKFASNPLVLLIASVAVLRFAPSPAAAGVASTSAAALIVIAGAATFAACFALMRPQLVWRWRNHTLKGRVANFVDLLSIAKESVVLVTGCLHHNLYNHEKVVRALENLDEDVGVWVYHEEPIDPDSQRFLDELIRRGAVLRRLRADSISHGAVIDGIHCKIEEFGVPDASGDKRVTYFAFDRRRARKALADIEAAAIPDGEQTLGDAGVGYGAEKRRMGIGC